MKEKRLHALQRQILRLERKLKELKNGSRRLANLRLLLFVVLFLGSAAALFWLGPIAFWIVFLIFTAAFSATVVTHRKVEQQIARFQIWQVLKETHVARMTLDWNKIPEKRAAKRHPLEIDFDLAGSRSIHQLLDTAVTQAGSQRLRNWLLTPEPNVNQILQRQQIVRELISATQLRNQLILHAQLASQKGSQWSKDELLRWLQAEQPDASLRPWLFGLGTLAGLNILLFGLWGLGLLGSFWQLTFGLYLLLSLVRVRSLAQDLFGDAAKLLDGLRQLTAVFETLEGYRYQGRPKLKALCTPFWDSKQRPSHFLRRLGRIVSGASLRGNPFLWLLLNLLLPWDLYFAYRLSQTKIEIGERLPDWLERWFELEALSSLASFAYLNPGYTFPTILRSYRKGKDSAYKALQLGHPLIPDVEKKCNDLHLQKLNEIGLITGSNMSGKSTFLRTVGVNFALAYAGGVVNADHLACVPYRLFSSIRVGDSLLDGISYFYAEVKRLKQLLNELEGDHTLPLFFSIDEIFRGTNNRERLIGSRAYITALAGKFGGGMIATHDLELVQLADELPNVQNYHFREAIVSGRMSFDYALQSGPSPTTNALKIMALEGLPVEW